MPPELPKTFSKLQLPPINTKKSVSTAEILMLVIIIVLFYWFVLSPKRAEVNELSGKLDILVEEQTKIQAQKNDLAALISKMNTDAASLEKLDEALPLEGKNTILQLMVEKFATEAGVVLDNVSFALPGSGVSAGDRELLESPYSKPRSLKKITGSISIRGVLSQVEDFMGKLETSGRIFDLGNFQMYAGEDSNEIILSLSLNTYYFAP